MGTNYRVVWLEILVHSVFNRKVTGVLRYSSGFCDRIVTVSNQGFPERKKIDTAIGVLQAAKNYLRHDLAQDRFVAVPRTVLSFREFVSFDSFCSSPMAKPRDP